MGRAFKALLLVGVAVAVSLAVWLLRGPAVAERDFTGITGDANRGGYVARLSGCIACHTNGKEGGAFLAGGGAIETPFGRFYGPNITPHPEDGLGAWTLAQFSRALTAGLAPDGTPLYPVFPYTHYTRMSTQDIADLWAALQGVAPAAGTVPAQDVAIPFSFRVLLRAWQTLFLEPGPVEADPARSEVWNRGRYIVTGPGHCGACHTPRTWLGAPDAERALAGTAAGPDGERVPAITAASLREDGWTRDDLVFALQYGVKPDGDTFSGSMGAVVEDSTSWLNGPDLQAIAAYLLPDESAGSNP